MSRWTVPLMFILVVAVCAAWFFQSRRNVRRQAIQAIERVNEYWNAGALLYEPRYLEAEKAVSDVSDVLDVATLRLCLQNVKLSRDYLQLANQIAEQRERPLPRHGEDNLAKELKETQSRMTKMRDASHSCIAQLSGE